MLPGSATRQSASPSGASQPTGQVGPPEDGEHPGRVRQRREARDQLRRDRLGTRKPVEQRRPLGVDERLHRLEAGVEPSGHEVFSFAGEEPELLPLPPRRELADELEPRVGGGGDQVRL